MRAARVAFYGARFCYFCSAACRERFDPELIRKVSSGTLLAEPRVDVDGGILRNDVPLVATEEAEPALTSDSTTQTSDARVSISTEAEEPSLNARAGGARALPLSDQEQHARNQKLALYAAALALFGSLLGLPSSNLLLDDLRIGLAFSALIALTLAEKTASRRGGEFSVVTKLTPAYVSTLLASVADLGQLPGLHALTQLSYSLTALCALIGFAVRRQRYELDRKLTQLHDALSADMRQVAGDATRSVRPHDLRPGNEIVVEAGETLSVDATIVAGDATVIPWASATTTVTKGPGDSMVAGARVVSGRLRAIVAWAGDDRAFLRLFASGNQNAETEVLFAHLSQSAARRISWLLALLIGVPALVADEPILYISLALLAMAALGNAAVDQCAALQTRRTVFQLLAHGVVVRTPATLDRAGRVSTAAFCARGTLLLGEPEVTVIEPLSNHTPEEVLALAAGAESIANHPSAIAVRRAARARNVVPDAVRSPDYVPGLGVVALSSSGTPLLVGSRGLMLKHRVGVAAIEQQAIKLEALGRNVLLIALDGHLIGLLALQDGLRPGARAAVQHLIDADIEPVLLSGDARETCEAVGRAVDIDHIRPEVLPQDRGREIQRLSDAGAVVAVIGRSPGDDAALVAANVSIALGAAGSTSAQWDIELVGEGIRDAAVALRLCRFMRGETALAFAVSLGAGLAGLFLGILGLPAMLCPLTTLLGALYTSQRLSSPIPSSLEAQAVNSWASELPSSGGGA